MKVRATNQYKKLGLRSKELKRIPKEGEEFEVTEERFKILSGANPFKVPFVESLSKEENTSETEKKTKKKKKKE